MTKRILLSISMFVLLFAFAACNNAADSPESGQFPDSDETASKAGRADAMPPLDGLVPAERIVILQSVFNPEAREGFYTKETRPAGVEIEYNGVKTKAYPVSRVIELLNKDIRGTVTVTGTAGGKSEFSAEDFRGMYAVFEFRSDAAPVFYNPVTKSAVNDFAYAVTGSGEAVYSVVSGSYHNVGKLLAETGWETDTTYRFAATDKFYFPAGPEAIATGEFRGGGSGVVNGSFPDLSLAHGKINDVLYIERIAEQQQPAGTEAGSAED